ncbi:ArsR family transcriptional regulator, partial [Haloarcula hispanica]
MSNTADDGRADGSPPSTAEFTPERVLSVFRDRTDQAKPLTAT